MIDDEIRGLYNQGGKHEYLVCERCNQECTRNMERDVYRLYEKTPRRFCLA